MLIACGVNPKKSNLFVQSHVPAHSELSWLLMCMTPLSWLNRMVQYKQKKGSSDHTSAALYSYPCLMAADIIAYRATKVPVGDDQRQHIELANDLTKRLNNLGDLDLPVPSVIKSGHQRVMSLRNPSNKMSKSDRSSLSKILMTDTREEIRDKIV
jgi:tryptophanyl-tRNA synthetase